MIDPFDLHVYSADSLSVKIRKRNKRPFVILPIKALDEMSLSSDALALYIRLRIYGDNSDHGAFPRRRKLAEAVFPGISWDWAKRRIGAASIELTKKKMVQKEATPGKVTVYWITDEDEWVTDFIANKTDEIDSTRVGIRPYSKNKVTDPGRIPTPLPGSESDPTISTTEEPDLIEPDPFISHPHFAASKSNKNLKTKMVENLEIEIRDPKLGRARDEIAKTKPDGSIVWDRYVAQYLSRYPETPARNAKSNAICANLVKTFGVDESCMIVDAYLASNLAQFAQSRHDLNLCILHAHKIRGEALAGVSVSWSDARRQERNSGAFEFLVDSPDPKFLDTNDSHDFFAKARNDAKAKKMGNLKNAFAIFEPGYVDPTADVTAQISEQGVSNAK